MSAKRYFKFDETSQYLENEADINYYIVNQARRVAFGNMLGDFNEDGFYVIDEKVIKELISMPKIVVDSVENVDLIRGAIRFDGYVHFMLNIEDDKAQLILLEKINFESNIKYNVGRYSNMNEYVLGEVGIPDRDVDKNIIYAKFNISREDTGKYYDFRDLTEKELANFSGIMEKMKRNLLVQNNMYNNEKAIEVAEADYFDNILSAFSKNQKLKIDFEKYLKSIILEKQSFLQINKPFFQKTMNEILDGAVLAFLSKLPPELRAEIEEEIRKAKEKYFYDFTKLIHLSFISNANVQIETTDNIINDIVINKKIPSKISQFEVDKKLDSLAFDAVLNENEKIKSDALEKNAGKKEITDDNPVLTKFFGELKKETGEDLLKKDTKTLTVEKAKNTNNKTVNKVANSNITVSKNTLDKIPTIVRGYTKTTTIEPKPKEDTQEEKSIVSNALRTNQTSNETVTKSKDTSVHGTQVQKDVMRNAQMNNDFLNGLS